MITLQWRTAKGDSFNITCHDAAGESLAFALKVASKVALKKGTNELQPREASIRYEPRFPFCID